MNQDLQNLEIKVENEGTTPQGRLTATEWNILVAAVKSLDLTGGSVDITSILQAVADAGYVTQEWVNNQDYATTTDFNKFVKDFVTLDTTQAISGIKDFTNGLKIGGLSVYKSQADTIYIDGNLVVRGGITAFGTNETVTHSIFDALPIDGETLKRTENGVLYVDTTVVGGGGGTGGGISIADVESYLTTNGYATQDWVTGKGYFLASNFTKATIKSTLGISDWALASAKPSYTASEVGALGVNDTATNASKLDGVEISNMFKYYGFNTDLNIFKEGNYQTTTHYINSTDTAITNAPAYYGTAVNFGARVGNFQLFASNTHKLYFRQRWTSNWGDWKTLAFTSDIPTKLSQLTDDVVSGKYLPLTGGTISQSDYWSTKFKSTRQTSSGIAFEVANGNVGYLMYGDGSKWHVTAQNWSATHTLLHSGNYSDYALPITGGTLDGDLVFTAAGAGRKFGIYKEGSVRFNATTRGGWATGLFVYSNDGSTQLGTSAGAFGSGGNLSYFYYGGSWNSPYMAITNAGNVGIGTTSPSEKLHVYGNILATGGITAQNSSDRRLKKNIRKFNASKVLMSLGGVWQYEYLDSEVQKNHIYEGTHYGLIYQHVKGTKLDVMCHEREDGMGALNYIHPKFISLIAGATMENISEVEKLKRKIRHLEQKVKQLESRA